MDALAILPDMTIHYGYFLPKERSCRRCGTIGWTDEEKMTDVNIAAELLGTLRATSSIRRWSSLVTATCLAR